jgi:hypothetical protein
MRTNFSKRVALKQWATDDGRLVISLVEMGDFFQLVEERLTRHPATPPLIARDCWEEIYLSESYETPETAERDALSAVGDTPRESGQGLRS